MTNINAIIKAARDILVGKIPDPKAQIEQITITLIYKFMDVMDKDSIEYGGEPFYFINELEQYSFSKIVAIPKNDDKMIAFRTGIELMQGIDNTHSDDKKYKDVPNEHIPLLFRDIFKGAFLPYNDPATFNLFINKIDEIPTHDTEILGTAFEDLLSIMGSQGDAGQFRTPRHIIDFIVEIIDPQKDETILDPACGTAGFLISAFTHILKENNDLCVKEKKKVLQNTTGYDISSDMVRLAKVNLYLHGSPEPKITEYDTLTSKDFWKDKFDVILANPPFMTPKGGIRPHNDFNIDANRSEVLFVDYIAEHLNKNGRAGIIVPEGIVFQTANAYKKLRKILLDENYLYAVISLPSGVFNPYSGVKTSILLMDKELSKKTDEILFAKVENDGYDLGAQRRKIKENDLDKVAELLKRYKKEIITNGKFELKINDSLFSLTAGIKEIKDKDYILVGDRYRKLKSYENVKWDMVELGGICETSAGGTPLRSEQSFYKDGTIPWLKSGEISQGLIYKSDNYITEEGLEKSSAKLFPINTVLIAMYGATAGQVGLLKFKASTNQAICGIYPNEKFAPEFLFYMLKFRKDYLVSLSVGGAQPNISQKIIKEIRIPLPPIEEQEKIVKEIEGYQKIVDGARQIIENYKPTIKINPDWDMVKIDEIFEKVNRNVNCKNEKGEIIYIGLENISKNTGEILGEIHSDYSKIKSTKLMFLQDDILYGKLRPNLNKVLYANFDGICSTDIIVLRKRKKHVNSKIYSCILRDNEFNRKVLNGVKGAQLPRVDYNHFKDILIPNISHGEQQEILKQIEKEQQLVEANKELITIFEQKIKDKISKVWGE